MDNMSVEELMRLAKEDPEALEAYKQAEIAKIIDAAPSDRAKARLRGIQFKVDTVVATSKNPLHDLQSLMFDSLEELRVSLNALVNGEEVTQHQTSDVGQVIDFRAYKLPGHLVSDDVDSSGEFPLTPPKKDK